MDDFPRRGIFEKLEALPNIPIQHFEYLVAFGFESRIKKLIASGADEETTRDVLASIFRIGRNFERFKNRQETVNRASDGRRLIGATSRAKVAKAANEFRHLSKGNAAYAMADIVNLDPGTIKRYLSEIFPGDKWKL